VTPAYKVHPPSWLTSTGRDGSEHGFWHYPRAVFFFFFLFIQYSYATYGDHDEEMYKSGSCPQSAQWRHDASTPLPSAQALPQGSEARGIVGAPSGIGRRLEGALGYSGRLEETTTMPHASRKLDLELTIEEKEAKQTAEMGRTGLTIFTDGSRASSGAVGYAVTWKNRSKWVGVKTHLGYNQEAFDGDASSGAGKTKSSPRGSHHLHGRSGGNEKNCGRGTGAGTEVRGIGQEVGSNSEEGQAGCAH